MAIIGNIPNIFRQTHMDPWYQGLSIHRIHRGLSAMNAMNPMATMRPSGWRVPYPSNCSKPGGAKWWDDVPIESCWNMTTFWLPCSISRIYWWTPISRMSWFALYQAQFIFNRVDSGFPYCQVHFPGCTRNDWPNSSRTDGPLPDKSGWIIST